MRNKTIYLFPGWEETTRRKPYQKLRNALQKQGYRVYLKNIDWKKKLSQQVFSIEDGAILFGFSLGAVFAKLLAERNTPKKVLLASMTEMKYFTNEKNIEELVQVCGKEFVYDIQKNLTKKRRQKNEITFYGEKEGGRADIVVKGADHELTDEYIKQIVKSLRQI